jgi:hypothetical protein
MPDLAMQLIADEEIICTITGNVRISKRTPLSHDTKIEWGEVHDIFKATGGVPIKRGEITTLEDAEDDLLELGAALYSGTRTRWGVRYEVMYGGTKR